MPNRSSCISSRPDACDSEQAIVDVVAKGTGREIGPERPLHAECIKNPALFSTAVTASCYQRGLKSGWPVRVGLVTEVR